MAARGNYIFCEKCGMRINPGNRAKAEKVKRVLNAYNIPIVCRLCFDKYYILAEKGEKELEDYEVPEELKDFVEEEE